MKRIAFFVVLLLSVSTLRVHAQTYEAGKNVISAGLGLGSGLTSYGPSSLSPGFNLQYERGIWEAGPGVISLGGYLGFKGYKFSDQNVTEKWNYTIVGARGAYHYTGLDVENLDLYGGLMLSYNNLSFSYSSNGAGYGAGSYGSYLGLSAFVGAKYFFSGDLGAFAEIGPGVDILNIGLSYKF